MPANPQQILDYLRSAAGRPLKSKELAKGLGVEEVDYADFKELLQQLEDEGVLYRVQRQRYAVPERINLAVGRLHTVRSGAGFVNPDDGGDDVYVAADSLGTAMHGDRVIVRIERRRRGPKVEGRIVRVLERARETIVGVFHPATGRGGDRQARFGFVVPEDTRLSHDVFIAKGDEGDAVDGDIVVVRVTHWGRDHLGPAGVVDSVIGRPGEPGVDVLAVIHMHGIETDFPPAVAEEAKAIRARGITSADLADRLDLRDTLIFTIDPEDAKDFDDALSITPAGDGAWEVGIHIADVAHYVTEGSAIDAEALKRGTSTYLVDRVIPMLPHELSTDLCSLRPHEDRLAMSLLLRVNAAGDVLGERLARTVIRSHHRLTYEQAQSVLDGSASIDAATDDALRQLQQLSRALREKRSKRGSLDFDLPEARVVLNTVGEPTDIQRIERIEAHRLIEDFMLLANESMARRGDDSGYTFVYRIHEKPDDAKLELLRDFAATFGHRVGGGGAIRPQDLQRFLGALEGRPEEALLSTVALRSMKQARYSIDNFGHFGLAAQHYTHFTSPIRRYPDLVVHRLAARYFLAGEEPGRGEEAALEAIAKLSSERERVAVSAERQSVEMKKVEFMERHISTEFDGTIASVRAYGFYVLLDAFYVEGLVHVSFLDDDFYVYVEEQFSLIGERMRRQFRLGDRVRVQVRGVDREERQIDFDLVSHTPSKGVRAGVAADGKTGQARDGKGGGRRKAGSGAGKAGSGKRGRKSGGGKSGGKARSKAGGARAGAKAAGKADAKAGARAGAKAGGRPGAKAGAKAGANAGGKGGAKAGGPSGTKARGKGAGTAKAGARRRGKRRSE